MPQPTVKPQTAARLEAVYKSYGSRVALAGLSFEIPRGSVCGLIGPNGAGKTTAMGVIAGLVRPDAGSVDVLSAGPFSAERHLGRVGMMPQDCSPSPHMTLRSLLRFYAELQGFIGKSSHKEADRMLDNLSLLDRAESRYTELSHGMRRRFSVAQALLGDPELVLLDEPTSGLDPDLVAQLRELLLKLRGRATLLVSSHILSELETICDSVIFMELGKCLRQGSLTDVTLAGSVVRYTLTQPPNFERLRTQMPGCRLDWDAPTLLVRAPEGQPLAMTNAQFLKELLEQNVGILQVESGESLETSYLEARARR